MDGSQKVEPATDFQKFSLQEIILFSNAINPSSFPSETCEKIVARLNELANRVEPGESPSCFGRIATLANIIFNAMVGMGWQTTASALRRAANRLERDNSPRGRLEKNLNEWVGASLRSHPSCRAEEARKRILEAFDEDNTSLDLSELGLPSLPMEIQQLTRLKILHLSNNELTELPETIGNCRELEILWIPNNKLQSLPKEIGTCTHLNAVGLFGNQLKSLPKEFGGCTELQQLWLDQNELAELPETIGNCGELYFLSIAHNPIRSLPEKVGKCHMHALRTQVLPS